MVLPAERYFADTAAKMSPCGTYTRSSSGGSLKESKIKKRLAFYFNSCRTESDVLTIVLLLSRSPK